MDSGFALPAYYSRDQTWLRPKYGRGSIASRRIHFWEELGRLSLINKTTLTQFQIQLPEAFIKSCWNPEELNQIKNCLFCCASLQKNLQWALFIMPQRFIIFAVQWACIFLQKNLFFTLSISILTLEKYTTKIYKTLIKCWYSWFQHSQSQWPYMESKQQLVITVSKACIHCVLCFIVWHANIDLVSFALFPKYKES